MSAFDAAQVAESVRTRLPGTEVREAEPMAQHTSFRAGGAADLFVPVRSSQTLYGLIRFFGEQGIPYVILGRGSNVLVSDLGYHGAVLTLQADVFCDLEVRGEEMICGAAVSLHQAAEAACEAGLSGMEALAGIPGSIGGALAMNAGAYGTEMKDVVHMVKALDAERESTEEADPLVDITNAGMHFGYRTSVAKERPLVFLKTILRLQKGNPEEIRNKMRDFREQRREKQPLEYPSAGSTFKRPEGHFAGKLIEEAGLRGYSVGGAQVSEKHCGFVINKGGASATDILTLMRNVRERVHETFGVTLEPEVMILGEEL